MLSFIPPPGSENLPPPLETVFLSSFSALPAGSVDNRAPLSSRCGQRSSATEHDPHNPRAAALISHRLRISPRRIVLVNLFFNVLVDGLRRFVLLSLPILPLPARPIWH